MSRIKVYEHSGKFSAPGVAIAAGLGVLAAIGLAFIYNILIVIIPFVYINFFIALGFGLVLGYCVKYFSRFGKIRSDKLGIYLAAVVGFVGYYFQWVAYFVFLSYDDLSFEAYQNHFSLVYDPLYLLDLIRQLNKAGSWSLFEGPVTGFALWFIWSLEALLIIGMPVLIMYKHPIIPYSELLEKWYSKYLLNYQFERISTLNQFKEGISNDVEIAINSLSYGESNRFSEVSIYFLEDEEDQYLSVDTIFIEDQGRGKRNTTPVVHLVKIDTKTALSLLQKYGKKKQLIFNY